MCKKSIYLFSFVLVVGLVSNVNGQVATNPTPADGALHTNTWAALSWSEGAAATSHNVYFGENSADVAAGTGSTFLGNQTASNLIVGMPGFPYPEPLIPDTTYYWRIDEVEADGTTIHKGDVWSFSLPPTTAYNPDPADGAIHVDTDVTFSWTAGMGAKLHHVYLGDNADDVAAGTGGTYKGPVATATYTPGIIANDITYYWRIDQFDGSTTHTGDVWSFTTIVEIPITDPNLICWWTFDEGTGATALDWSGHDTHGTIVNDPEWVDGYDGYALHFGTGGGYDSVVHSLGANEVWPAFTLTLWVKADTVGQGQWSSAFSSRVAGGGFQIDVDGTSPGNYRLASSGNPLFGPVTTDWVHLAVAVEGLSANLYYNGSLATSSTPTTGNVTFNAFAVGISRSRTNSLDCIIDDFRIYHKVLTQAELQLVMKVHPLRAREPSPAHGSTPGIDEALPLTWSSGDKAAQHDVYFGTDRDAVADADTSTTGIYRGRQNVTGYTPPEGVEWDQTHYWRVDEYNADGTISKGSVWAFMIADFILVDDFESYNVLDPMDPNSNRIFLKWLDGYLQPTNGSIVGYQVPPFAEQSIVNSGSRSMPYFYDNSAGYSEATMTLSYPRDWTKHGVKALSLWFRGYPASISSFTEEPAGIYRLAARSVGNISGGDSDEFHFAYQQLIGAGSIIARVDYLRDADDNAQAGVMIRDTLDPDSAHAAVLLESDDIAANADLHFRRRATKAADSTTTTVDGPMAPQWLKIERDAAGNVTGSYSADGVTWTDLGGEVITMSAPAYIGLAVTSENAGVTCEVQFSNVQITGATGQWANQDVGILNNTLERMYVSVANSGGTFAAVYWDDPDDPNATPTQVGDWTQWNIDLKGFADQGVNLANVDMISIGFGDKNNPQPGGSGKMYFDDIRLYPARCMTELLKPAADLNDDCVVDYLELEMAAADWLESDSLVAIPSVTPDPAGLVLHYTFDGDARDSSGNNHHGIAMDGPTYVEGKFGQAIHLDGFDDYVAITDVNYAGIGYAEATVCVWVRTTDPAGQIATFDRSENWRLEIGGGEAGGDGLVGWHVWDSAGQQIDSGLAASFPDNTGRVDDGQWHHLAGVFDNGALTIYIDGNPKEPYSSAPAFGRGRYARYGIVGSGSEASYPPPSGRANGPYLEADLDELYIYDRALSQTEIRYLADETPGDGELYLPVPSVANLYNEEPPLSRSVNFKDFALLADGWLDEQLWPGP